LNGRPITTWGPGSALLECLACGDRSTHTLLCGQLSATSWCGRALVDGFPLATVCHRCVEHTSVSLPTYWGCATLLSNRIEAGWISRAVSCIARVIADEGRFEDMPILADALEDAGCTASMILMHCRNVPQHLRGCWVPHQILERCGEAVQG
jgi:hypothetical protein